MTGSAASDGHDGMRAPLAGLLPAGIDAWLVQHPNLYTCVRATLLLVAFIVVDRLVLGVAVLPETAYFEPILFIELARRIGWPLGLAALLGVVVLARFGALMCGWPALGGNPLRVFVVFLAAVLSWFAVTRGYNFYFDQAHWYDKLLLLLLLALSWTRPVWVLPLSVLLAVLILQQAVPLLGGSILAHKLQLLHVLTLFSASVLLHAVTGRTRAADFVLLTCCMVAGSYFSAALAKIQLQWWNHDQLHLLPISAYAYGWLDFLGADGVAAFARMLRPFGTIMNLGVLLIEAGCLLFCVHRRVAVPLLVAVVMFHFGVLALYGFFFWTWILLDIALLALLLRSGHPVQVLAAGWSVRVFATLLIATAVLWSRPPWLGWMDTGLTYTYRFEALGESGRRYELRPEFFAPYEDVFTMTGFSYLTREHRMLTAAYGITKDAEVARGIAATRSPADVFALEEQLGRDNYNEANAERMRTFLTRYAQTRNRYTSRPPSLAALGPPAQFLSHRDGARDTDGDPLTEIVVVEVTTWFDGRAPTPIRRMEVARVPVPPAADHSTNRSPAPSTDTRQ